MIKKKPVREQTPRAFDGATYAAGLRRAVARAQTVAQDSNQRKPYEFPIQPPKLYPGVVPSGSVAPVMAMDYSAAYTFAQESQCFAGFPGFAYLSQLATRAEFRSFASAMSTELTREWIEFKSSQNDGDKSGEKIKKIEAEFKRLNVRGVIRKAAEQDCYFGRGQVFLDIKGSDRTKPLILDPRSVGTGSFNSVCSVEAIWTTPSAYNANDPTAQDFYKPSGWFILGQQVHASRLSTIITRELPDILKPAFNFGGMSLSQLAEPYVDNWLRTRQSVSDLINNFSITALQTNMSQVLQGVDDGASVFDRATLFTLTRSNKGLMILDKENEALVQMNVPLSGLHELQAQSQEQLCSVGHTPSTVLLGVAPSGFGNVAEGEMEMWRDWITAQFEAYWRAPIEIILKVVQLSLFGEIDPDITISFRNLCQMTPTEEADIRLKNSQSGTAYIDRGVIAPEEERERLASDPASGYQGLDVDKVIVAPNAPSDGESGFAGDSDDSTYDNLIISAGGNPSEIDPEQFALGLRIEQEHFGTTGGNEIEIAGIVLDHLREIPDYYSRLAKMESAAGVAQDKDTPGDEHWITMKGRHVQVDKDGKILDKKIAAQIAKKEPAKPAKAIVPASISAFAKKTKSKITPTNRPPGNLIEIKAGALTEDNYYDLSSDIDTMSEAHKGTDLEKASNYAKRAIEIGSEENKYNVSVQLDGKGAIVGACSMHLLPDSMRIEHLGGMGKGAGKSCLISAINASVKAGKKGAITLTPVGSAVSWYAKMGFVSKTTSQYGEFWLSPEAAQRILK